MAIFNHLNLAQKIKLNWHFNELRRKFINFAIEPINVNKLTWLPELFAENSQGHQKIILDRINQLEQLFYYQVINDQKNPALRVELAFWKSYSSRTLADKYLAIAKENNNNKKPKTEYYQDLPDLDLT